MGLLNQDVYPRGIKSAYVNESFHKGLETLGSHGYSIISLRENSLLRIQEGFQSNISRKGNWTREGFIAIPKKGIYLTKNSPILSSSQEATKNHRNKEEFYPIEEQIENALENSYKMGNEKIPAKRLGESGEGIYLFGDCAESYGEFLQNFGINEISIVPPRPLKKTIAKQIWFRGLKGNSVILGDGGNLFYHDTVRGISYRDQNKFSKEEVHRAIKDSIPELERIIIETLDKKISNTPG